MAEKTLRGALEESKKVAREAAVRALHAMEPGLKAVREATGKIRERVGYVHPPRVDRVARTVQRESCVYEVEETKAGTGQDGSYVVRRRSLDGGKELVGGFDVKGLKMTVRREERASMTEIALVAAAWIEEPNASSAPS